MDVNLIETLTFKHGIFSALFTYIGILRFFIKPAMGLLLCISKATDSKFDDKLYVSIKKSWWYCVIIYVLDWFTSFKIKK